MISVTLKQIAESVPAFREIVQLPVPATVAYRLAKISKAVEAEYLNYEATRTALCARFGALREDGLAYEIPTEKVADFNREMEELHAVTIELPFESIALASLGENSEIKPATLMALDWLITEN